MDVKMVASAVVVTWISLVTAVAATGDCVLDVGNIETVEDLNTTAFSDAWYSTHTKMSEQSNLPEMAHLDLTWVPSSPVPTPAYWHIVAQAWQEDCCVAATGGGMLRIEDPDPAEWMARLQIGANQHTIEIRILWTDYVNTALVLTCADSNVCQQYAISVWQREAGDLTEEQRDMINQELTSRTLCVTADELIIDTPARTCDDDCSPDTSTATPCSITLADVQVHENLNTNEFSGVWYGTHMKSTDSSLPEAAVQHFQWIDATSGAEAKWDINSTAWLPNVNCQTFDFSGIPDASDAAKLNLTSPAFEFPVWILWTDYEHITLGFSCTDTSDDGLTCVHYVISVWQRCGDSLTQEQKTLLNLKLARLCATVDQLGTDTPGRDCYETKACSTETSTSPHHTPSLLQLTLMMLFATIVLMY